MFGTGTGFGFRTAGGTSATSGIKAAPFTIDLDSEGQDSVTHSSFDGSDVVNIAIVNESGEDLRPIMEKDSGDDSQVNFVDGGQPITLFGTLYVIVFK